MSAMVNVKLVGADSYATLTQVYNRNVVFSVSREEWSALSREAHPVTGTVLFAEATDEAPAPVAAKEEITITTEAPAKVDAPKKSHHKAAIPARFVKGAEIDTGTATTAVPTKDETVVSL